MAWKPKSSPSREMRKYHGALCPSPEPTKHGRFRGKLALRPLGAMLLAVVLAVSLFPLGAVAPIAEALQSGAARLAPASTDEVIGYAYLEESEEYPGYDKLVLAPGAFDEATMSVRYVGDIKSAFGTFNEIPWREYLYPNSNAASLVREIVVLDGLKPSSTEWWFMGPTGNHPASSWFTVDLHGLDVSSLLNASAMFSFSDATEIVFPHGQADIASDGGASALFYGSKKLKSVDFDGFSATVHGDLNYMFSGCSALGSLDLSGFSLSGVTDMVQMFAYCSSLRNLNVSSFDTSRVGSMDSMFDRCSALSSLDLSSFDTSSVTSCDSMFYGCDFLSALTVGSSFGFGDAGSKTFILPGEGWHHEDGTAYNAEGGSTVIDAREGTYSRIPGLGSEVSQDMLYALLRNDGTLTIQDGIDLNSDTDGLVYVWESDPSAEKCAWSVGWGGNQSPIARFVTKAIIDIDEGIAVKSMKAWLSGCNNLTEMDIRSVNASAVTDMSDMFASCYALPSADLSAIDAPSVKDMYGMFVDCYALESVKLPRAVKPESMNRMFFDCSKLSSVEFNGLDLSNAHELGWMFTYCSSLKSLDLSDINMPQVCYYLTRMFVGCSSLEELSLPDDFINSKATGAPDLFSGCSSLKSLDLENADTSGFQGGLGGMFSGCRSLEELKLPNDFVKGNIPEITGTFEGCEKLAALDVSGWDTSGIVNADNAFARCASLTELDFSGSGFTFGNLVTAKDMLTGCASLDSIKIGVSFADANAKGALFPSGMWKREGDTNEYRPERVPYDVAGTYVRTASAPVSYGTLDADGVLTITMDKPSGSSYAVSEGGYAHEEDVPWFAVRDNIKKAVVRSTGSAISPSRWFAGCVNLESVVFVKKAVEASGDGAADDSAPVASIVAAADAFNGCAKLTYVGSVEEGALAQFDVSGVNDDGRVDLTSFDMSKANDLSGMFDGCALVESFGFPEGERAIGGVTNYSRMFAHCTALEAVDLSGVSMASARDLSGMFDGCRNLKKVVLPSESGKAMSYPRNMARMFRLCTSLASIDLSAVRTTKVTDFSEMFRGCRSLESLNLAGFSTRSAMSMNRMLHGCTSLSTLKVGNNFTFFGAADSRLRGCEFPDGVWQGTRQASTEAVLADSSEEASEVSGGSTSAAYASDSIPSFTADTYTRVEDLTGVSVISLFGSSGDRYAVEQTLNAEGEVELAYDLGKYERDSIEIGDTISAAAAAQLTSSTVKKNTVVREVKQAGSKVTKAVIRPSVNKIEKGAFAKSPSITKLKVVVNAGSKLNKKSSILGSLKGSKIKGAGVQVTTVKIYPDMNEKKIVSRAEAVRLCFSKYAWRES